jgi:hypothetical protein
MCIKFIGIAWKLFDALPTLISESRLEGGWIGDTCKLKLYPPTRSLWLVVRTRYTNIGE